MKRPGAQTVIVANFNRLYVFMLAVFPQFIAVERSIWPQATALTQAGIFSGNRS